MTRDSEVLRHALSFRRALEELPDSCRPIALATFPAGSCGEVADLLGTELAERGFGDFHYVCGERLAAGGNHLVSHAWLEQGSLIVDITADQFSEVTLKVIVTRNSDWHAGWQRSKERIANFRLAGSSDLRSLEHVFSLLKRAMSP